MKNSSYSLFIIVLVYLVLYSYYMFSIVSKQYIWKKISCIISFIEEMIHEINILINL